MQAIAAGTAAAAFPGLSCGRSGEVKKPNIIYILADDLGYNELGCYGQEKIRTPNIDKLAAEGMRFTQHYSGSPVCAPSRCALLTGQHTGHTYIRGNDPMAWRGDVWNDLSLEGSRPIPENTVSIGKLLKKARYSTGVIGKWGLGGPDDSGHPNLHGFDHWYGYLCQRIAHNYYPPYLWRNREKVSLEGNPFVRTNKKLPEDKDPNDIESYKEYSGKTFSQDLIADEAEWFIRKNRENPFFLYLAFTTPHVSLQVPEDSLEEYLGEFPETPYKGEKGYLPHRAPRAAYAAMVTRMDKEIGRLMDSLKELGIDDNTLVVFSSDNGPTYNGGTDSEFFNSTGLLRGLKGSVYEGGIKVPMIARWPGKIKSGTVSDHVSANWDLMPTFTEIAGESLPEEIDGISMLPELRGNRSKQRKHEYLYWEHARKMQAVRLANWKGVRLSPDKELSLYDLSNDPSESIDQASKNPRIVNRIKDILINGRTESEHFPLKK